VLNAVDNVTNIPIERRLEGRRAGDPAMLGSGHRAILEQLDRTPRHADLDGIVCETLAWERAPADTGHLKVQVGRSGVPKACRSPLIATGRWRAARRALKAHQRTGRPARRSTNDADTCGYTRLRQLVASRRSEPIA
jgi:hypothetical protein